MHEIETLSNMSKCTKLDLWEVCFSNWQEWLWLRARAVISLLEGQCFDLWGQTVNEWLAQSLFSWFPAFIICAQEQDPADPSETGWVYSRLREWIDYFFVLCFQVDLQSSLIQSQTRNRMLSYNYHNLVLCKWVKLLNEQTDRVVLPLAPMFGCK